MTRAAIIAVGTELVLDGRRDTNGERTALKLAALGIETRLRAQVPDDAVEIARILSDVEKHCELVIVTGGLGPTMDDVTLDGVAGAFSLPLQEDPALREDLETRYGGRGRPPGWAARQSRVPRGAGVLTNRVGSAPGLVLARPGGCRVVLMPGVPGEMEVMLEEQLLPVLAAETGRVSSLIVRGVRVAGMTESRLQERIADLVPRDGSVSMTLLASPFELSVLVRGKRLETVERVRERIKERLGSAVFTERLGEGLEWAVGRLLAGRGLTMAAAESCTGGLLSRLVTEVPGASSWFLQGWVTYSNASKLSALEVPGSLIDGFGAVSEEVAAAMSESARRLSGSDIGVSITGIAGPGGATEERSVGTTFIGLCDERGTRVTHHRFHAERAVNRLFAARVALNRIRLEAPPR